MRNQPSEPPLMQALRRTYALDLQRRDAMAEGITTRHARSCAAEPCTCHPSYQAHVWSNRDGRRIRKTFPTLAAARSWRTDAKKELQDGTMRAPTTETLRQFADFWLEGAETGTILSR